MLTANLDRTARLYDYSPYLASTAELLALADARITRNLTPEERRLYLHE